MTSKQNTLSIDDATPEQIAGRIASLRASLSSTPEAAALRDADLQRFLIARQFDLEKSLLMIQNYFAWKKELKIDEIPHSNGSTVPYLISTRRLHGIPDSNYDPSLPGVREDFAKFHPATGGGCYHGYDKQGRPLYIERAGAFEVRQFAETCSPETFRDFFIRNFEFMFKSVTPEAVKVTGKPVEQLSVIMDCTGMGLRQFHIPGIMLLKVLADLLQNYYPERLGRLYIINAPIFFNAAWAIIKVWLDKRIIDKVNVLGSDYAKVLNDHIDHHQLPSFLGGSCTCSHMEGGCVPLSRGQRTPANPAGYRFTKALKKSSNTHSHDVHVAEHGSTLTFQYTSSTALTLEIHETDSQTRIHQAIDQTSGQGTVTVESGKKYRVSWKSDQLSSYSSAKLDYSLDVVKPKTGGKTKDATKTAESKAISPVSPDTDEFHDAEEGV